MRDQVVLNSSLSVNGWRAVRIPNSSITDTRSFSESRFARSPWPRRRYSIPFDQLTHDQREYLGDFYDGRIADVISFLIWDRDKNYVNAQQIGIGDGATTVFRLGVTVGDATRNSLKPLWAPCPTGTAIPVELQGRWPGVPTTFWTVTVGGVAKVEGTDFAVDPTTGLFTFAVPPPNTDDIVITGWYFTVVRFYGEEYEMDLDSIYGKIQTQMIECFNE
jgi:hypothetical protein